MDARQIDLYVQRGRLRERISVQRAQLAREMVPVSNALQAVDRAQARVNHARIWLFTHPAIVAAAVVAVLVWRPRTALSTARWGYKAWRNWLRLKQWLGLAG